MRSNSRSSQRQVSIAKVRYFDIDSLSQVAPDGSDVVVDAAKLIDSYQSPPSVDGELKELLD